MEKNIKQTADPQALARQLIRRAHKTDGLPEVTVGLIFLLVSGLLYAQAALPRQSPAYKAAILAFAFGVPILIFTARTVIDWLRRRYLLERSGYVEFHAARRGWMPAVVTAALPLPIAFLSQRWLLALTGLSGGLLIGFGGGSTRFTIAGAVMAATGAVLSLRHTAIVPGFAILFGIQGALILVSGVVVFARFVRRSAE